MKTAIVIPFYNGDDCIRSCLKSIANSSEPGLAVSLINNSDKPTDIHRIAEEFPNTTVMDTKPHIGYGHANNVGAAAAISGGAEVIISINQDTILDSHCVTALLRPFHLDSQIGIVTPILYTYDFGSIEDCFLQWYITQCPGVLYDALKGELKDHYRIKIASGACFAIRSEIIKKYGLFDELYFMYDEDDDLCRRIGYTDYRIVIALGARMAHKHSNSEVNPKKRLQIECWQRSSQVVFELKDLNYGLFYNFAKIIAHSVFDCSRNILRLNLKACVMFFWSDIKSLAKIAGILRSRKREIEIKNERLHAAAVID